MRTVIVGFETTVLSFPGVFTPGQFRVSIVQGTTVVDSKDVDAPPVSFELASGNYEARAVRLGAQGEELGQASVASFTVPEDATNVDVPIVVSVSIV